MHINLQGFYKNEDKILIRADKIIIFYSLYLRKGMRDKKRS